ncbi:MAG TPA: Fe(3+) ABC transporter substrate-binding protein [Candidatus Thiothrix moscowensis]|uniref:Fe(3+) ABC transporter substrate-binding protein n=1 Tax=unclassified Thiothrix TaxID=2636184 RepID=UPI0025EFAC25|nr:MULTISPECIES: Fe(3+) ABC transporter substrate-binding protein [unclassified Thiothrix]HRJ52516.1 Fe(3+) ABC transporter substrate-binding protein [Candidatus Thiothrix moscowensis]HRJ93298.1 Fe(3+) ABC transporter substrate-binding protein [Candidatus Thiothrix moscowensis]
MLKKITLAILVASLAAPAFADGEVNVYSSRKEQLIKPLFDKFTESTGIKVNLVTGKDDALLERLKLEGENTPADLLMTADAGRLHRAVEMGLTQPVESETLKKDIPATLRDPANQWFGLTSRARPIFYVKDKVKPEELSTYEALTDEKWKGRICVRSSDNIYNQSMLGSMIAVNGVEKTQAWAEGFVRNFARPPEGGDRDQIKAAAAGQCDIALSNTYYYGQMLTGEEAEDKAAAEKVAIFWPNQQDRGVHVNISGAAVTKVAKNKDNAVKLMEFLVSDESQKWYAEANQEYPVKAGVAASEMLKSWGEFKADSVNLSELGKNNAEAVKIMDKAGWK